jgi:hypothetical protein
MVTFSNSVTDKLFAPYMSEFIEADIPDMNTAFEEQKHWLANYVLNTSFRGKYNDNASRLSFNLMRRCEQAFLEYELARIETIFFSMVAVNPYQNIRWQFTIGKCFLVKRGIV